MTTITKRDELKIVISKCQNCNSPAYTLTPAELLEADGFSNCEYCGYPVAPSETDLNQSAANIALDEQHELGQLFFKPSSFFVTVSKRTKELFNYWLGSYQAARSEWKATDGLSALAAPRPGKPSEFYD